MEKLNVIIKDNKIHKVTKNSTCSVCSLGKDCDTSSFPYCDFFGKKDIYFKEISINELLKFLFNLEQVDLKVEKQQANSISKENLQVEYLRLLEENKLLTSILVQKGIF